MSECDGPTRGQCPRTIQIGLLVEKPCAVCPSRDPLRAGADIAPGYYAASDRDEATTIRKG